MNKYAKSFFCGSAVLRKTKTVMLKQYSGKKKFSTKNLLLKFTYSLVAIRSAKADYSDLTGPLIELFIQIVILLDIAN